MHIRSIVLSIGVALCAGLAAAEEGRFTAGPTVGMTFSGVLEPYEVVYGGRVSVRIYKGLSVELGIMHVTDEPEEERIGIDVNSEQEIIPIHLSLRYGQPLFGKLDMFILAGVGYYISETSDYEISEFVPGEHMTQTGPLEVDRMSGFGYHVGTGFEYHMTQRLSFVLEYRYGVMDADAEIHGLVANSPDGARAIDAFEKDFWDNNEMGFFQLGLNWTF